MAEYISNIIPISAPRHLVYKKLSDLSGLSTIAETVKSHPSASGIGIEVIDADRCSLSIPMAGKLQLHIVEREPEKLIKLEAEQSPIPLTLWTQLVEKEETPETTYLRLSLHTELNFLMKQMLGDKLQDAVNKLAETFGRIPYSS